MANQHASLVRGITESYENGLYTDIEVTCNGRKWKAHKLVLCSQSIFFSDACDGPFREGFEGKMDLPNDDPNAVDAMIEFLYIGHYRGVGSSIDPPILDVRVFSMAEKYGIKPLKVAAAQMFQRTIVTSWTQASFADAIAEIYTVGPAEDHRLKDALLGTVAANANRLFADTQEYAQFHAVLDRVTPFAADVARMMASKIDHTDERHTKMKAHRCPNCGIFSTVSVRALQEQAEVNCPSNCFPGPYSASGRSG